ncbi:HAD family hydrolase [Reinekea blandensis]|uniref:Hydrolase n=1 Tax=Reinekea blandensis MED297 TaxID=314283 RepID=A4BHS5_9GAMM|nr:HAD-IIB family hydrolase [Reinekea blandensis]EAR08330.1 hypothetical protein MED297_09326 [Reinekea sp. MED297] [Reinekea blandensis MED297]
MPEQTEIRFLLTDVDDTLTTDGKLLPETLAALVRLQNQGIRTIAVTGACAGWCDQMIRLWPLDAVIGENGAFVFYRDEAGRVRTDFYADREQMAQQQRELRQRTESYLTTEPTLVLAHDQAFRYCDVAVDFAPSPQSPASPLVVQAFMDTLQREGYQTLRSSIHINCWSGEHNKRRMTERFLMQQYGLSATDMLVQCAFIGDAPNDEPMFAWLPATYGVANIRPYIDVLTTPPATILDRRGGLGFVDLVDHLLQPLHG